jgi:hypothetical protein
MWRVIETSLINNKLSEISVIVTRNKTLLENMKQEKCKLQKAASLKLSEVKQKNNELSSGK